MTVGQYRIYELRPPAKSGRKIPLRCGVPIGHAALAMASNGAKTKPQRLKCGRAADADPPASTL